MTAPHHSLEAEEELIAGMLSNESARVIDSVIGTVEQGDFYREAHGIMFTTATMMHERGDPVDPVTLSNELEKYGKLEAVGGTGRLKELAALMPAPSRAAHYAKIVKDKAVKRGLLTAGQRITELAELGNGDTDELIVKAEQYLSEAMLRNTTASSTSIVEGLDELLDEIRLAYTTGERITGQRTGVSVLDKALRGMWPGQLLILAARPAVGKSTLAQNIAENVADSGSKVLFVTLEMSKRELITKGLSRAGKIDSERLAGGEITEDEAKRLGAASEDVRRRGTLLRVDDSGVGTVPSLTAEAYRLHRHGGLGLIVVDYIQLMSGVGNNKAEEVGSISRGLKMLARRLDVPILALSQMNRNIMSRSEKRPDLADLRDSGSLEQDADVVMFLHRDSDFDTTKEDDGTIEIIVAKNRRGPTGTHSALFTKRFSSFLNAGPASP